MRRTLDAPLLLVILIFPVVAFADCGIGPRFKSDVIPPTTPVKPEARWACMSAPTDPTTTTWRPGAGAFAATRSGGAKHTGVDLMLSDYKNMCVGDTTKMKPSALEVYAIAEGVVAYSRSNTAAQCPANRPGCDLFTTGLGFTVIIDHGNGIYSLYSHMAQDKDTAQCLPPAIVEGGGTMKVKKGQKVKAGDLIGYLGSIGRGLSKYEMPSGNAAAVEQAVQLHFELFEAPIGRRSDDSIAKIADKTQRGKINPVGFLEQFYK